MNILITGAGGTLGKAFTRLLKDEHDVIGCDLNEWSVAEFESEFPEVQIHLNDFDNWRFNQDPVDVVIHCAAYKHVTLGEKNPHTFIENNVTKTGKLFAEAYKNNVDILFISTDKAVEPICTYGFTKSLGEKLAWHYNGKVARLGNILNSTGSVIPIWEKAIEEQKPIKLTDIRMKRYVINDSEAVKQIWSGYQNGDKLIVPIMGEPIFLVDLMDMVLKKHGYMEPKDYKPGVEVIGMKTGEKLEEALYWKWEE